MRKPEKKNIPEEFGVVFLFHPLQYRYENDA